MRFKIVVGLLLVGTVFGCAKNREFEFTVDGGLKKTNPSTAKESDNSLSPEDAGVDAAAGEHVEGKHSSTDQESTVDAAEQESMLDATDQESPMDLPDAATMSGAVENELGDLDASSMLPEQEQCVADEHYCGVGIGCVSNYSPMSCGASCSPCAVPKGGEALCDGERCVAACPDGEQLCAGECIAEEMRCDAACPEDTNLCAGLCATVSDPNNCGEECTACPVPQGAQEATCEAGECGFVCPQDSHTCGDYCASNDDLQACGAACEVCEPPQGGSAECVGGQCRGVCPNGTSLCAGECLADGLACEGMCAAGSHDCSGNCLADDSPASCGQRCDACPGPAQGGSAVCNTGACDIQCNSGFHHCDDQCVSNGDVAHCGSSCSPCTAPPGGTAACDGVSCQPICPNGTRLCSAACLDNTYACSGICPSGTHECDGRCFAQGASCGALGWSGSGDYGVNAATVSRSFTLSNAAPFALTGLSLSLNAASGGGCAASPANLWQITSQTCGSTIAAGQSCSVTVQFDPSLGAAGTCYQVDLVAAAASYNASLGLSAETEQATSEYTWQIQLNSNTFTYDSNAPAVGSPCTSPGEVRDAQPTEISYTRRFVFNFTTTPPSQGSCSSGKYAVSSCEYYQGDTCAELQLMPNACGVTCTSISDQDTGCQLIYRKIICQ